MATRMPKKSQAASDPDALTVLNPTKTHTLQIRMSDRLQARVHAIAEKYELAPAAVARIMLLERLDQIEQGSGPRFLEGADSLGDGRLPPR